MKLIIKNSDGDVVSVEFNGTDTFKDLLDTVKTKVGLSLNLNDIAIKGKKITESQRLVDYFGHFSQTKLELDNVFCVVPGCNNTKERNRDKVFFEFPTSEIRCHQWVLYCQRLTGGAGKKRIHITPESTICSDHFRPDQFVKNSNTLLKRTAVPCMKFLAEESIELQDKYSEGHDLCNFNSLLINPTYNCVENDNVRLCRLCASPSNDFYQIFDDFGKEMKIAEKIHLCLPIKIEMTDLLPKQICKSCFENLNDLFEMADQCSITQNNMINAKQINLCQTPDSSDSEVTCYEEKHCFEMLCPLCFEGKLNISDWENFNYNNEESSDYEAMNNSNNDYFYSMNECDHFISTEDNPSNGQINESYSLLDSGLHIKIGCLSEIKNNSSRSYDKLTQGSLSGLALTPLKFEELNNNDYEELLLPKSDNLVKPNNIQNIFSKQLIKDSYRSGIVFICRICAKEFLKIIELLNHSFEHSCQNFYQCCACVVFFHIKEELQQHLQHHLLLKDIITYCEICHQSLSPELLGLESHVCAKESNVYFLCPERLSNNSALCRQTKFAENYSNKTHCCDGCGKIFKSKTSMKYHQRYHQSEMRSFSCSRCGKCFVRKSMLINHIATSHSNKVAETSCMTCKYCHESFPNTEAAVSHMDNVHKLEFQENSTYSFEMETVKEIFVCEFCERCFVDDSFLNNHREKHPPETPYECKYCYKTFMSDAELNSHKSSHESEKGRAEYLVDFPVPKTYLCEYCERCFTHQIKYSEHLTIHFGPEPYRCRYCPILKFQTLYEAMEHRGKHGGTLPELNECDYLRPYDCHYCTKRFAIEDALIKHIRMHTGEKPFLCEHCGKSFSQSSGLYTHEKVHSNVRPYSCSVCPRTFKIKGDRDVHVRKHSGDRPYKCECCGKAFMTQHVYSQHKKIHTGERPYKCDVCGIAFRRSHVLTVHKRIHTGEKPNVCHVCGKSYRQKGDMMKHCRIQHGLFNSKKMVSSFQIIKKEFPA